MSQKKSPSRCELYSEKYSKAQGVIATSTRSELRSAALRDQPPAPARSSAQDPELQPSQAERSAIVTADAMPLSDDPPALGQKILDLTNHPASRRA